MGCGRTGGSSPLAASATPAARLPGRAGADPSARGDCLPAGIALSHVRVIAGGVGAIPRPTASTLLSFRRPHLRPERVVNLGTFTGTGTINWANRGGLGNWQHGGGPLQ